MTAPLAGDIIEADHIADAMLGRVDQVHATSNASATSGTTELTVDTLIIPAVNGYRYRFEWNFSWQGSVLNDTFLARIRVAGSQVGYLPLTTRYTSGNQQTERDFIAVEFVATSTASLTITSTLQRNSGSGTCTAIGATSNVRLLTADYLSGA